TNTYSKQLETFFSQHDLKRIYTNNPCWADWEQKVYGNQSQINWHRRASSKARKLLQHLTA
ncbi:MAG: hypothetical protein VW076_08860, partial [Synechococcus sp.]